MLGASLGYQPPTSFPAASGLCPPGAAAAASLAPPSPYAGYPYVASPYTSQPCTAQARVSVSMMTPYTYGSTSTVGQTEYCMMPSSYQGTTAPHHYNPQIFGSDHSPRANMYRTDYNGYPVALQPESKTGLEDGLVSRTNHSPEGRYYSANNTPNFLYGPSLDSQCRYIYHRPATQGLYPCH